MPRVGRVDSHNGALYGYEFVCPGCDRLHILPVGKGDGSVHARWEFNGDTDLPTFHPSVKAQGVNPLTYEQKLRRDEGRKVTPTPYVCHSWIKEGRIEFLNDCTHKLKGHTVDLNEYDPNNEGEL